MSDDTQRGDAFSDSDADDAPPRIAEETPAKHLPPETDGTGAVETESAKTAPVDAGIASQQETERQKRRSHRDSVDSSDGEVPTEDSPKVRVNPFFGAAQFFSVRGFFAACALFLITLLVCLLAIDLVWALAVALLFTIAVSAGHLVFYTQDRHIRERIYFAIVALGAFFGGALVLDLQLTHPYFIRLRKFHADTVDLKQALAEDIRFVNVSVETKLMKTAVADLAGTVQKPEDLKDLRSVVEATGFWIGDFEVTVATDRPAPSSSSSESDSR